VPKQETSDLTTQE